VREPKDRGSKASYDFPILCSAELLLTKLDEVREFMRITFNRGSAFTRQDHVKKTYTAVTRVWREWIADSPPLHAAADNIDRTPHSARRLYIALISNAYRTYPQTVDSFCADSLGHASRAMSATSAYGAAQCAPQIRMAGMAAPPGVPAPVAEEEEEQAEEPEPAARMVVIRRPRRQYQAAS
jgi:hypothetical protein